MVSPHLAIGICNHNTVTVRNNLNTQQKKTVKRTPNNEYAKISPAHIEEVGECIPTKSRSKCREIWDSVAISEKQLYFKKS